MGEPRVQEIPLSVLRPDKRNANLGTDRGREALRKSLETYGAGRSILLDRNGVVLAGNKTREQAEAVALIEPMVKNSSRPGDLVYDPFLGSGSTILACQSTGRVAYGCEIDPQYASVCLARWEAASGQTASRLS